MKYISYLLFVLLLFFAACNTTEPDLSSQDQKTSIKLYKIIDAEDADLIINSTSNAQDCGVTDIPGPDGLLTLREAIFLSNELPGKQKIAFNIPTTDPGFQNGVFTFHLSEFWGGTIADEGIILDGETQTEFTGDTNPYGPEIVLDGSNVSEMDGIRLISSGNHLHSLVINNFSSPGIHMSFPGIQGNKITGCYIGTDETGTIAKPNNWIGILMGGANSGNHIIGGPEDWERNVISGNYNDGIQIHTGVTGCLIQGNYIGVDATGMNALGNAENGISLVTSSDEPTENMTILDNVISGNTNNGINITSSCIVKRNLIGTDKLGNPGLGNGGNGIRFSAIEGEPSVNNIIGGSNADGNIIKSNFMGIFCGEQGAVNQQIVGNIISNNNICGIGLENSISSQNLFSQNSIYDNEGLGIDLNIDGVTYNDEDDLDSGPNGLLNFPVIEKIKLTKGRLIIQGYVDDPGNDKLLIEFYANHNADQTSYGEGEIYLGSKVTNPHGKFTITFPPIEAGMFITALTIDNSNNTSEYSLAYLVE